MEVIITNISGHVINASDLGLYLEDGETSNLYIGYSIKEILDSTNLQTLLNDEDCTIEIDSESVTWAQLTEKLTGLTLYEHEVADTLKHNISETSYFEIIRDGNNLVQNIIYYTDNTKTVKVREEIIARDGNNRVSYFTVNQHDLNGVLLKTETQTLSRNQDGNVINMDIGIS